MDFPWREAEREGGVSVTGGGQSDGLGCVVPEPVPADAIATSCRRLSSPYPRLPLPLARAASSSSSSSSSSSRPLVGNRRPSFARTKPFVARPRPLHPPLRDSEPWMGHGSQSAPAPPLPPPARPHRNRRSDGVVPRLSLVQATFAAGVLGVQSDMFRSDVEAGEDEEEQACRSLCASGQGAAWRRQNDVEQPRRRYEVRFQFLDSVQGGGERSQRERDHVRVVSRPSSLPSPSLGSSRARYEASSRESKAGLVEAVVVESRPLRAQPGCMPSHALQPHVDRFVDVCVRLDIGSPLTAGAMYLPRCTDGWPPLSGSYAGRLA
ncbi:hypothetical protein CDD83_2305 [Cordyceps sp. RAO-2017]|nr:hypothetical protein CDD83_2305 [Cordyceps sp. RAO-2017]